MARHGEQDPASTFGACAGVAASLVVAILLSLDRGPGQAVPALALMLVVIAAAAVGGRGAGVVTAVAAALSFNFWHTRPYLSLRIHDASDVVTTLLLLAAGLTVGALASARERHAGDAAAERSMLAALAAQADLIAAGADTREVWALTRRALVDQLDLADVRLEPATTTGGPGAALASLARSGAADDRDGRPTVTVHRLGRRGFLLPPEGAEIALLGHDVRLGRLVLTARSDHDGLSATARHFALTMAEQLALAAASGGDLPAS